MKTHKVYLSRRNLLTLLAKLDAVKAGDVSACTLIKRDNEHPTHSQTMSSIAVTAVEDDVYYVDRNPGPVLHLKE